MELKGEIFDKIRLAIFLEKIMGQKQDAIDILNGFIADICVAVKILKDYERGVYPKKDDLFRQSLYRLCLQSIILNCAKYTEFCREYGSVLQECCPELQKLSNQVKGELEKRGVNTFRTKYVAHNGCNKTKKPFTTEQTDQFIKQIVGDTSALNFLNWLLPDDHENLQSEDYFTGFLSILRDRIHTKL